jgi:hypothetical protein
VLRLSDPVTSALQPAAPKATQEKANMVADTIERMVSSDRNKPVRG